MQGYVPFDKSKYEIKSIVIKVLNVSLSVCDKIICEVMPLVIKICFSCSVDRIYIVAYINHQSSSHGIGGIMVSMLALDRTKDYKIGICWFSARYAALRSKSKYWLAWNQNNVSEWSDMSTCRLLFQWASTIKIQFSVLV